jgi:pimeloyl-ACP methyl ester carboxylesterase
MRRNRASTDDHSDHPRRSARPRAAGTRFPRPATAIWAAGLLAAVSLSVATSQSGDAATPAAASTPIAPPVPKLDWKTCDEDFQCATAQVPLDYRDPYGKTINIAVERHQATDTTHRIGSLFVNGGGPSEQLANFTAGYKQLPSAWRAQYDIVGFDPRGFGSSTAVRCFPTAEAEDEFLSGAPIGFPDGAKETSAWIRTWAGFDERCAKLNGSLLEHLSTADVARDMDLLRQAVGDRTLNYMGLSYGTVLGATYANLFPATVGRMALDGDVDPVAWTNGNGGLPSFLRLGNDQASAAVLKGFLDLCGKASTAACAFSAGTPAATRAKYDTLLRRLRRHPVTMGTPPDTQSCGYACGVLSIPLGSVSTWQTGADLLQQMWVKSHGGATASASAVPKPKAPPTRSAESTTTSPAPYTGHEQYLATVCSDSPNPRDPRAYSAAARLAYASGYTDGCRTPPTSPGWRLVTLSHCSTGSSTQFGASSEPT